MRAPARCTVLLVLALPLIGCSGRGGGPSVAVASPTALATLTPRPSLNSPGSPAPRVMPAPVEPAVSSEIAPQDVLATGTPVAFQVCSRTQHWQRPDMAGMARVFTDRRFGDGTRPDPGLYALYLSQFFYIGTPTANSANKENVAFSGIQSALNGRTDTTTFCDMPALGDGMRSQGKAFQELWLIDHHVTAMRWQDRQLVVQVEDAPQTFEDVVIPFPPATAVGDVVGPAGFFYDLVQVLNERGDQIYEQRAGGGYGVWQAGGDGRLLFALFGGRPGGSWRLPVEVGPEPATFDVLATGREAGGGELKLTDESDGGVLQRTLTATGSAWDVLDTFDLSPGRYRLQVDGGPFSVVMLRHDVPRP